MLFFEAERMGRKEGSFRGGISWNMSSKLMLRISIAELLSCSSISQWHFLLQALHKNYLHFLQWAGRRIKPFIALPGVRQGCPASSSRFAIITDLFIRTLCRKVHRGAQVCIYMGIRG